MTDFLKNPRLDVFKSLLVRDARFSSVYEFPLLKRSEYITNQAIPFDKARTTAALNQWIHFYIHDLSFECVWNMPNRYLPLFQRFDGVITPDFSLYREMPLAMQLWNTYRNRALGYFLQSNGVPIIPNVRWGDERTYAFAFEGLSAGGTVAVSTSGSIQHKIDRYYFKEGLTRMVEVLKPTTIINYSRTPENIFAEVRAQGIEIIGIENYRDTVRRAVV